MRLAMSALYEKSATELAALIRSKEVSSREVVQAHLDRIDAVNSSVNAVTVVLAESALRAAAEADNSEALRLLARLRRLVISSSWLVRSRTSEKTPAASPSSKSRRVSLKPTKS